MQQTDKRQQCMSERGSTKTRDWMTRTDGEETGGWGRGRQGEGRECRGVTMSRSSRVMGWMGEGRESIGGGNKLASGRRQAVYREVHFFINPWGTCCPCGVVQNNVVSLRDCQSRPVPLHHGSSRLTNRRENQTYGRRRRTDERRCTVKVRT